MKLINFNEGFNALIKVKFLLVQTILFYIFIQNFKFYNKMDAVIVLAIMVVGIIVGYIYNNKKKFIKFSEKLTNWTIYLLLFLLGVGIGANKKIINNLDTIGYNALILTIGAVLGSIICALIVYKLFFKSK